MNFVKNFTLFLVIFFSVNVNAKGNRKVKVLNDITDTSLTTLTFENNIYNGAVYDNTSIIHTTSSGLNIGISSMNIPIIGGGAQNYENDTYIVASKTFEIVDETYNLTIGSQNGYTLPNPSKLHSFEFIDNQISLDEIIDKDIDIHFGLYHVNKELSTISQTLGSMCGFEYKFASFSLQADYFSGHNNLSGANINTFYNFTDEYAVYLGVIIPEKNSGNDYAGVIGITYKLK